MNLNNLLRETVTFQGWCIILLSLLPFFVVTVKEQADDLYLLTLLLIKALHYIHCHHCLKTPMKRSYIKRKRKREVQFMQSVQ